MTKVSGLTTNDLEGVFAVASSFYPVEYYESRESFVSKIEGYPEGCQGLFFDGVIKGYLISYPFAGAVPKLSTNLVLPERFEYYWIHDMCILEGCRYDGYGTILLGKCFENCSSLGLKMIKCASLPSSQPFWEGKGFEIEKFDYHYQGNIMVKQL